MICTAEIIDKSKELCDQIFSICPDTDITIFSLITRNDDKGSKVAEVNNLLEQLCTERNYRFFLHDNINQKCLNRSGLHLNKYGTLSWLKT